MKPDMGIFMIKSEISGKGLLYPVQDLKGKMNRFRFQLEMGSHPNKALQKEWTEQGAGSFSFTVLENLDYDKDETKTDYSDELELLRMEWEQRLGDEGMEFYEPGPAGRR